MAQSKAKKKRNHLNRNGLRDVTLNRGSAGFSTHERRTKTKLEKENKLYSKYPSKRFEDS